MTRWLARNACRIAGVVGLLALWVVDASQYGPGLTNGFWTIESIKAFHLGITVAVVAFIFVIVWERK